jgi:hypothetical protein
MIFLKVFSNLYVKLLLAICKNRYTHLPKQRCAAGNDFYLTLPRGFCTCWFFQHVFTPAEECSPASRDREVDDKAEMVAGPHPTHWFVKDPLAGCHLESWSPVLSTAHKEVVDASEWPVPILPGHQRISRRESMARFIWVHALPGVSIADAHATQRLTTSPEVDTRCIRVGIQVTT